MAVDAARLTDDPAVRRSHRRAAGEGGRPSSRNGTPTRASTSRHEGGAGYFFFVIESGAATVTRDGETLAEFGPGDFFGEAAIFKTRRRTATVTTTEPTILFAMFGADFAKLVRRGPVTAHEDRRRDPQRPGLNRVPDCTASTS